MWIEEMYGDMKRHGFQIQNTQIQDAQRISRLMLGVALAYAWLLALGAVVVKRGLRPRSMCAAAATRAMPDSGGTGCSASCSGAALRNGPSPLGSSRSKPQLAAPGRPHDRNPRYPLMQS